jgi:hypothetical protein
VEAGECSSSKARLYVRATSATGSELKDIAECMPTCSGAVTVPMLGKAARRRLGCRTAKEIS